MPVPCSISISVTSLPSVRLKALVPLPFPTSMTPLAQHTRGAVVLANAGDNLVTTILFSGSGVAPLSLSHHPLLVVVLPFLRNHLRIRSIGASRRKPNVRKPGTASGIGSSIHPISNLISNTEFLSVLLLRTLIHCINFNSSKTSRNFHLPTLRSLLPHRASLPRIQFPIIFELRRNLIPSLLQLSRLVSHPYPFD